MTSLIIALAALVVALIALLRDNWEHRHSSMSAMQELQFRAGATGIAIQRDQDRDRQEYSPSVFAMGPGTRYDVRTYLWVEDLVEHKRKDLQQTTNRFDNTSAPLSSTIEIYLDDAEKVWFGIGFNEPRLASPSFAVHMRSQFVRSNLGRYEVQVWQWYRFSAVRKWWGLPRLWLTPDL
ncbi:hypothetical protein [Rhodococcus wratislaviensis]|uniref:hypothetical protein n=1 Tax=Rhodococcus wratislaviensis TaxID=44752 RepID=UPI003654D101